MKRPQHSTSELGDSNTYQRLGGIGVKDLHSWNLACILKLIWMIFFRPNSVWVCWFKEVILRGDISNYWTINTSSNYSWLVNKMIKARDLIYPLLKRQIGIRVLFTEAAVSVSTSKVSEGILHHTCLHRLDKRKVLVAILIGI